MPSKKKKYNSRFPPARIKKIMQMDDEVGKVAAVVPVIISRALELFVETLLNESRKITISRNARTLTPSHLKASTLANSQFLFLRDLLSSIPDIQQTGEEDQSDGNLNSGPSASGVKVYRRTNSKSNHNSANNNLTGRGRGRPKKSVP
ncbi:dr1-associated corepressor-like isoform X1, partial [Leptotrombidium deliense]